ncbi:hypothetical protein Tco_1379052 [Tanacetum coccineum]
MLQMYFEERGQYHEIQYLKAQMQDKNIAISELKKLIEMFKRKGVDTNFEQPSILGKPPVQSIRNQPVVRQPTAYKSERYQCPQQRFASQVDVSNKLTKPATPHSWHQMKESSLAKPNDLIAPGPSRNCPKHVSHQSPREKVGSNDMVPHNQTHFDGGGGSGVVEVARGASGVVDRVDRSDGESFGLRRKNPPEKFSGGGGGRRLPDMGGREER